MGKKKKKYIITALDRHSRRKDEEENEHGIKATHTHTQTEREREREDEMTASPPSSIMQGTFYLEEGWGEAKEAMIRPQTSKKGNALWGSASSSLPAFLTFAPPTR